MKPAISAAHRFLTTPMNWTTCFDKPAASNELPLALASGRDKANHKGFSQT
jgi:hypothetical protein